MKKIYSCLMALAIFASITHAQTIRPEFPFTDGRVASIIKYGNAIYIGGDFSNVIYPSGVTYPRENVAAFDATTGAILPWDPKITGGSYLFVSALAAGNNVIYIGGFFTPIGGVMRPGLAAVDPITGTITGWNPQLTYKTPVVAKILATASTVYAVGAFGNIPTDMENVIALDPVSGQNVSGFSSKSNSVAYTMELKDDRLYVGGLFTTLQSQQRQKIAAISSTGSVLPWNPSADNAIYSLAVKDDIVFAGGDFTGFGYDPINKTVAVQRKGLAAIDANTGSILPWNPGVNGSVRIIKVDGNNVYLGGSFDRVGLVSDIRNNIALVNAISGGVSLWNPNANGQVQDILVDGNTIFVGGSFTTIAGQSRPYFAALTAPIVPVVTCPTNITVSNAPNTCGQLVSFAATATGSPAPQIIYHSGLQQITSPYYFPVGTSSVEVVAGNIVGSSYCSFTITVNDIQAPAISNLAASTSELWPANKKMRDVWIDYTALDNCTGTVTTQLSITSNEPSAGDDLKIIDNHHIQLKAERLGNGNGRIYTITITARDQYGNTSSKSTTVSVPHDQSKNATVRNNEATLNIGSELLVTSRSNPSHNYFTLSTQSGNTSQKVNLRLYDVNGRLLEVKNIAVGETIQMGKTLTAGFYLLQYSQGNTIKQMNLIKQY